MSDRPDLNDAVDELYGTRLALDGVLMLLATSNSEKINVELIQVKVSAFRPLQQV